MRLAIITNTFPTFSETFISNKVKWLSKTHQIIVLCFAKNKQLYNALFAQNPNVTVFELTKKNLLKHILLHPFIAIPLLTKNAGKGKTALVNKITASIINSFSPNIVHFEFSGIAINYVDEIKNIKGKKIVSCRGSAEKVKLLTDSTRKENLTKVFDQVDAIHCVSKDMRYTISPWCAQPEKVFINYPSIDTTIFQPPEFKKNNHSFTILSIGRFTFQKGYLTGLLAIKILQKQFPAFQWLIVGEGTQQEEIIFHIHNLGLQNHVHLLGKKTTGEVRLLYTQADCFFLPSVYEGIANVALEAMSMELPVVSTRSGGMDEVITHGINGFLANVYDSAGLAAHLLLLANNPKLRVQLGEKARIRVIEKFSIQTQMEVFENIYTN